MLKAIKLGIIIYLVICISNATGVTHQTTDKDYMIPEPPEFTMPSNGDTARHYKQIFTRQKRTEVDINN